MELRIELFFKLSYNLTNLPLLHKDIEILFIKDHYKFRLSLLIFDRLNKENLPLYLKNLKSHQRKNYIIILQETLNFTFQMTEIIIII